MFELDGFAGFFQKTLYYVGLTDKGDTQFLDRHNLIVERGIARLVDRDVAAGSPQLMCGAKPREPGAYDRDPHGGETVPEPRPAPAGRGARR